MHHLLFSLCLAAVLGVGTYPDIEGNQIVHEYNYSSPSYLFRMNWGWDGSGMDSRKSPILFKQSYYN